MRTISIGRPTLTNEFYAIKRNHSSGLWYICLAGRQGLGTTYCTPFDMTFRTRKLAKGWRDKWLAKSPHDYWIAPTGKYLLLENGTLKPCHGTEKQIGSTETENGMQFNWRIES